MKGAMDGAAPGKSKMRKRLFLRGWFGDGGGGGGENRKGAKGLSTPRKGGVFIKWAES